MQLMLAKIYSYIVSVNMNEELASHFKHKVIASPKLAFIWGWAGLFQSQLTRKLLPNWI